MQTYLDTIEQLQLPVTLYNNSNAFVSTFKILNVLTERNDFVFTEKLYILKYIFSKQACEQFVL